MADRQKKNLRRLFNKYDAATRTLVATATAIKAVAPAYWKARGYDVMPRLERLRDDVFKEDS